MIFRLVFLVIVYIPFMIVALPVQAVLARFGLPGWNFIPLVFHRLGAAFLGLKVTVIGQPVENRPVLILSNHISWTDIVAVGSVTPVTFVAKQEVRDWFFVGFLASLQRTLFVDRTRRSDAHRSSREMGRRIADGGAVLLFAEGQSDIGTHVLPFRTALIGAAQHSMLEAGASEVLIQPLTIAYTKLQGLPVSRSERSLIAWVKSKSVWENIRGILGSGVKEVTVAFGVPRTLAEGADRKQLSKQAENDVRRMLVALNRGLPLPELSA